MRKNVTQAFCVLLIFFWLLIGREACKLRKKQQGKKRKREDHTPYGIYEAVLKRPLDILLAGTVLIFLCPVMLIIGFLIKIKLGTPIIFTQQRPGLNGKIFTLYKYRTMIDWRDGEGKLLPDEKRLTPFGKMLRSTSLDELPELINILKGDMSVVGPRPLLVEYLPRYSERQRHRHDVRPGLTGYAQVSGRNSLSWDEKFEMDLKYVDKITFLGDLKILLKTIDVVLRHEGISSLSSVTMESFIGNDA